MKKLCCVLLILCLLPGLLGGVLTASGAEQSVQTAVGSKSGILTIADPTQDEIRAAYAQYQKPTQRYSVAPSVKAPYAAGVVDANYLQQALNYLNYYRMVAKLQPLQLSPEKNNLAQHGAVLLGVLNQLLHDPADSLRPSDMDVDFFQTGKLATAISTISSFSFRDYVQNHGWEQTNLYKIQEMIPYVLMFQIRDYDRSNFQCLGHRRYLLSPYLKDCGFGVADSADAYTMYFVVEHSLSKWPAAELVQNPDYDYIAWPPSGNCPQQLMEKTYPWSVCLNEDRYLVPAIKDSSGRDTSVGDRSGIVIRVTRQSDGRVWTFDQNSPDGSAISNPAAYNAPYFYIDKRARGFGPVREDWITDTTVYMSFASSAIIFRPDFEDNEPFAGIYNVRITGLKTVNGSPTELNYQVNFFDITPCEHAWSEWYVSREAGCTEEGLLARTCSICGAAETQTFPALGHAWSQWETALMPDCEHDGAEARVCSRCGASESRSLAALGHAWGGEQLIREPGCTEPGLRRYQCQRCDVTREEEIAALGHDWDEGTVTKEPSCTENGLKQVCCQRCGTVDSNMVIPALGHDWDAGVVTHAPGCTSDGAMRYSCQRCGETRTEVIPTLGHDWDEGVVTKEPSPQETGERLYTCRRCGETKREIIPRLANPFVDVVEGKYYYNAVLWAYYHNPRVTGGTDDTHFSPNKECKREQVVSFLYAACGRPEFDMPDNPFTDVLPGKYYYKAIMWALAEDVTGGVSADKFGVGKACTREQVVTFLWKACGKPGYTNTENPFTDVLPGKYYYKAIMWAKENNITGGVSADKFGVGKACTRGQIVTFLYKAMRE